jgi:hypothetical protein
MTVVGLAVVIEVAEWKRRTQLTLAHDNLSLNEDGTALAQPRLATDGDVRGGRYVSGVVDIYVGTGPAS